jgi:carbamoyl-phosphate synthase small subunit
VWRQQTWSEAKNHPLFFVHYHPEAAPGPHDSLYLFDDFIKLMAG